MLNTNLNEAATMIFIGPSSDIDPGLGGLFPDSCDTVVRQVRCSSDKPDLIEEVVTLIGEEDPAHTLLAQKAALMVDEMLENALYAAPRAADGSMLYQQRESRNLLPDEQITLRYRYDDTHLFLEVRDSWGSLSQSKVFSYLAVNTQETEPEPDRTGRGLFFMWRLLDHLYVRIYPGRETVVGGSLLLQPVRG
jgi:anti-sigma regulatory factor (Ser/Thr protein kinase)